MDASIARKVTCARTSCADLQPWPGYYEFKAQELETVLGFYDPGSVGAILEIGCGNAFTACLLADRADRVSAFDLPAREARSHSIGIGTAGELIRRMGCANVAVIGGTAEALPFPDDTFDLIFSAYAIQYIGDKGKALAEMYRVLRDGGTMIAVVPNVMERIYMPFLRCQYIAGRLCAAISTRLRGVCSSGGGRHEGAPETGLRASPSCRYALAEYATLRPDGAYRSYREEMARHTPRGWRRLLEANGFRVRTSFTTQVLPLAAFQCLGAPAVRFVSKAVARVTRALGGKPVVRSAGYSIGLVAVKERR